MMYLHHLTYWHTYLPYARYMTLTPLNIIGEKPHILSVSCACLELTQCWYYCHEAVWLFTKYYHMCYQLWHGFVSKSRSECISSKVILYIVGVKTPILQRGNLMHSTSRVWVYYTSKRKLYIWYTILQRGSPTWNMSRVLAHNNSQRKPYIHAVHRLQRGNLTCSMSWVWAHHLSERKPYMQCTILQRGNLMCCMSWVCVHHTSERKLHVQYTIVHHLERKPDMQYVMGVGTPYSREKTIHGVHHSLERKPYMQCAIDVGTPYF